MKKIAADRNYRNLKKIAFISLEDLGLNGLGWWNPIMEEVAKRGLSISVAAHMTIWIHRDTLSAIWKRKRSEGKGPSEAAGAVLDKMIELGIATL